MGWNAEGEGTMAEKKLSFEQGTARLEEIVARLESGQAPLDESLKLFEEGSGLLRDCSALLDAAEQKVEVLLGKEEET